MKRKLIKQGKGGFTVTLPIGWVRKSNLDGGEELEVQEVDQGIIISSEKQQKEKEITLSVVESSPSRIRTMLSSAYRRGYTTVILASKTDLSFTVINKIVDSLLGFVIVEQKKNKVVIKNVMKDDTDNVESILAKYFVTIHYLQQQVISDGKESEIRSLHQSIIKLRDYCQRMIHLTAFGGDKCYEYNTLVFVAEKIAANYFDLTGKKLGNMEVASLKEKSILFSKLQQSLLGKDLEKAIRLNNNMSTMRKKELQKKIHPVIFSLTERLFALSSRTVGILI